MELEDKVMLIVAGTAAFIWLIMAVAKDIARIIEDKEKKRHDN